MKNEDVYLGGNYGKDGIATVYGLAVYFGHKDPRNISWKCSSTVKDVDGAELEALVYFLEWCSTHDHNEPCNFAVRTSSSALITWILVHLPTYKEYGWTHTEQDESIPYEEILRYVDALLDQIPIHPQSPKLSFSLIPAHAVVDGNGHALKLAKKAVAVDAAVKSRDWEALTYVARVDIVHTITSPGFSSSAKEMEDAMMKTQQARMRLDNRKGFPPVENRVSNIKAEGPEVISLDTDEDMETGSASDSGDDDNRRASREDRRPTHCESSSPPMRKRARRRSPSPSSSTVKRFNSKRSTDAPAVKIFRPTAHIRSSEEWRDVLGSGVKDSRLNLAKLCERVDPNFGESKAEWQRIPPDLRDSIWDHLLRLRYRTRGSKVSKTGNKRKSNEDDSCHRPNKTQKTSSDSKESTSPSTLIVNEQFMESLIFNSRIFTSLLCRDDRLDIGLIVIFRDDDDRDRYTALDHLPHLVAAINKRGKRRVTLVTFPQELSTEYTANRRGCFALNRSSYEHDEELIQLLREVPQPWNPVAPERDLS